MNTPAPPKKCVYCLDENLTKPVIRQKKIDSSGQPLKASVWICQTCGFIHEFLILPPKK